MAFADEARAKPSPTGCSGDDIVNLSDRRAEEIRLF